MALPVPESDDHDNVVGVSIESIPPAPVLRADTADTADGEVTLLWSPVAGANDYRLYWSLTLNPASVVGTPVDAAASPRAHTGLVNGTTCYVDISRQGSCRRQLFDRDQTTRVFRAYIVFSLMAPGAVAGYAQPCPDSFHECAALNAWQYHRTAGGDVGCAAET